LPWASWIGGMINQQQLRDQDRSEFTADSRSHVSVYRLTER